MTKQRHAKGVRAVLRTSPRAMERKVHGSRSPRRVHVPRPMGISLVEDRDDLELLLPPWHAQLGDVADALAEERARDGGDERDVARCRVGLVHADDPVTPLAAVLGAHGDRRAEADLVTGLRRRVDELCRREPDLELTDPGREHRRLAHRVGGPTGGGGLGAGARRPELAELGAEEREAARRHVVRRSRRERRPGRDDERLVRRVVLRESLAHDLEYSRLVEVDEVTRALEVYERNPGEALALLKLAWPQTRDPDLGDVIDALGRRAHPPRSLRGTVGARTEAWLALEAARNPADVHTLLDGIAIGRSELALERVERIACWSPDPEVASALMSLFEQAVYPSQAAMPFWSALAAAVAAIRDPRSAGRLERLAARPWRGSVRMNKLVRDLAKTTASAIRAAEPSKPLQDSEATARDELVKRLVPREAPPRTDEELLAAVLERPDDDDLRRVYGDALLGRGDPRGELIALEYARHEGRLDEAGAKRETALLRKHRKAWLGPLADVAEEFTFERGFVATLRYVGRYASEIKSLTGSPAWATVRALRFVTAKTTNGVADLLVHPVMRSLRDVRGLTVQQVQELGARAPQLEALGFGVPNESPPAIELAAFPRLRELEITSSAYRLTPLTWLQRHAVLGRLERLVVQNGDATFGSWLEAVRRGTSLRALVVEPTADGASGSIRFELARGPSGELDVLALTALVSGRVAHVREPQAWSAFAALRGALAALPRGALTRLRVLVPPPVSEVAGDELRRVVEEACARLGVEAERVGSSR